MMSRRSHSPSAHNAPRAAAVLLLFALVPRTATAQVPDTAFHINDNPVWAPDGQRILFVSDRLGNRDLYVIGADGSGEIRLTSHQAVDSTARWSPDGKEIAFSSERDGHRQIYLMHADGSNVRQLTDNPFPSLFPAWSPDGRLIVYNSGGRNVTHRQIYRIDRDGSEQRRLLSGTAHSDYPQWSPDGERILFESERTGTWQAFTMDATGDDVTVLDDGSGGFVAGPRYAPTGDRIAYHADRSGTKVLFVMDADGGSRTPLPAGPGQSGVPDWSPDGNRIAFSSTRTGYFEIYVLDLTTSRVRQVTSQPEVELTGAIRRRGLGTALRAFARRRAAHPGRLYFSREAGKKLADELGRSGNAGERTRWLEVVHGSYPAP